MRLVGIRMDTDNTSIKRSRHRQSLTQRRITHAQTATAHPPCLICLRLFLSLSAVGCKTSLYSLTFRDALHLNLFFRLNFIWSGFLTLENIRVFKIVFYLKCCSSTIIIHGFTYHLIFATNYFVCSYFKTNGFKQFAILNNSRR